MARIAGDLAPSLEERIVERKGQLHHIAGGIFVALVVVVEMFGVVATGARNADGGRDILHRRQ